MKKIKTCLAMGTLALSLITVSANADNGQFVRVAQHGAFETDFTSAADKTINSVVCIKSYVTPSTRNRGGRYMSPFDMDPFEFFFGTPQQQQPRREQRNGQQNSEPVQNGLGSGVIISEDGYIVTNNHVIAEAERIEILLNDNSTYDAKVVGTDEMTDLALLKIEASDLQPITFGNSDALKVGEWVLAVGNPFGFNSTVTAGIVSAKARSIGSNNNGRIGLDSYIQTDAALNPGNSGGALVNLNGELVGINSAIYSNTGSYTGYSFAIPTTVVHKIIEDLRQYGAVQRAVLGVTISELTAKTAKEKGITTTNSGLLINSVEDRSTAKEMGLKADDVITEVNNVPVHNMAQLREQMNQLSPGNNIDLTIIRDNKKIHKNGTLRNNQGNTNITKKGDFTELGCAFIKVSDENKKLFGISYGVQVAGLKNGIFKRYDIPEGFIIQEINGERINSSDDVERIYNSIMTGDDADRVMFITGLYPTGKRGYKAVDLTIE